MLEPPNDVAKILAETRTKLYLHSIVIMREWRMMTVHIPRYRVIDAALYDQRGILLYEDVEGWTARQLDVIFALSLYVPDADFTHAWAVAEAYDAAGEWRDDAVCAAFDAAWAFHLAQIARGGEYLT